MITSLKVGVIGAGGIARSRHIPGYLKNNKVNLAAVADVSQTALDSVQSEFGIPVVYTDYREMLDKEELDAVSICTPNKFHAPAAIYALQKGLHVFCEKPMALNAVEAKQMLDASKTAGKILSIAFHYRHMAEAQAAKRIITAGELGDIYMTRVQALRRRGIPSWGVFTNKELQGGGALVDFGVHFLDLALWLIGNPKVIEVSGTTSQHIGTHPNVNPWGAWNHNDFQVEDHAAALLRFEGGGVMQLEASWALNIAENVENVSISGVEGGLDVFPFKVNKAAHGMLLNWESAWMPGKGSNPGDAEIADFVDAILEGRPPLVTAEEALQVSEVMDAVYRSSAEGRAVRLN